MNINLPTIAASVLASGAVSAIVAAGFVNLQDGSPGTPDTGHINVTGNVLAGKFGSGVNPTLARVQVKETGALQGVRAESGSGVAVFGKSTAASGLGAGGYFTTSSVGGRGIVGDALSGTGNTVGGLFYNRSTGGGVAVWGRAIGAGTATGVFGEVLNSGGTALAATNTGSGNGLTAGTSADSLLTDGPLPRHRYTGSTSASMVPLAYGFIASNGAAFDIGSGNWSSVKDATGSYSIDIQGVSLSAGTFVVVATAFDIAGNETVSEKFASGANDVGLVVKNHSTGVLIDSDLEFVVYRTSNAGTIPPGTLGAQFSEELRRNGPPEAWTKRDPKGFAAWQKRYVAWQREAMKIAPYVPPVDDVSHP